MAGQAGTTITPTTERYTPNVPAMCRDGVIAGILGAAVVAVWFLIIDVIHGRPLLTPTVLGTALLPRRAGGDSLSAVSVSLGLTAVFTLMHGLVFVVIGTITSLLLTVSGQHPGLVFGILLLFVLEFGFSLAALVFAEPVLELLAWQSILVANLLAAAAMAGCFWLRRRRRAA